MAKTMIDIRRAKYVDLVGKQDIGALLGNRYYQRIKMIAKVKWHVINLRGK